ncbi:ComEC/Rec2 family competence protein, partial [Kitasatospora sp. NPDC059571]|uniref:ComEC/Rec2 family competence protein n=1 Tax=Kitasatospora sp. NPDC059571 TaxID=3346871 RepID=UPI0036C15716
RQPADHRPGAGHPSGPGTGPQPPPTSPPVPPSTPRHAADLRLLTPALAAWAATSAVLAAPPDCHPRLLAAAAAVGVPAALLLLRRGLPAAPPRRAVQLIAAVLLTTAAATATTVLHTADLHQGPIPVLARPPAPEPGPAPAASPPDLSVDLTVTGDPRTRTGRVRGTLPGQDVLTLDAVVDRVDTAVGRAGDPAGPGPRTSVRTHTPVTVLVRAQDIPTWLGLTPSTRVSAEVRAGPPGDHDRDSAALLSAHGPPHLLEPPGRIQRLAARLRTGLRRACDHLPADTRGLLPGLVVGDTSRLPDDLREAFRATDLGHLVAVSGANLAIVLTVLVGAPRRDGSGPRGGVAGLLGLSLRTTALAGACVTLAFVTVCRPDPSVLRAAATGLIGLLALATGRSRHGVPVLSGAVLLLVLFDPFLARSYGFLLSTLATAGLLLLAPRWAAALRSRGWPSHLATGVAATAAAQACCAPVTVLLAPRVSLVALPCNLLAEVAVAPATLLGFAALAVEPVAPGAARAVVDLAAVPTGWLSLVARHGADLPGAQLGWVPGPAGAVLLAAATLALCWAVPALLAVGTAAPARVRAVLAVAVTLVLAGVLVRPPVLTRLATGWPPPGWRFVLCDVGQGDMAVLPTGPDTAVVVDTGPDPGAADGCLRTLGITRVPLLVLTHFHADHVEGMPGVLRGRRVGAVEVTTLGSPPGEQSRVLRWAAAAGVPVLPAVPGEHRVAGPGLSWDVLWPDGALGPATPGANNASIALLVTLGVPDGPGLPGGPGRPGGLDDALRLALLGDLEPPAQQALLRHGHPPGRVDVLKVAHHGSAHQDWELTGALHPRLALISCGADNPYGHPAPATVDRLRALGATVLRTDRSGDLAVLGSSRAGLAVATHPSAVRR